MANAVLDAVPTYVGQLIQGDFGGEKKNAVVESNILLGSLSQAVQPQSVSGVKKFSYTFSQPTRESRTTISPGPGGSGRNVKQVTVKNLVGFYGVVIDISNFDRLITRTYLSPLVTGDFGTILLSAGGQAKGVVRHERITHTQQVIIDPNVCQMLVRAGNAGRPKDSIVYQGRNYSLQAIDIVWSHEGTSAQVSFLPVWEWWSVSYPAPPTKTCFEKGNEWALTAGSEESVPGVDPATGQSGHQITVHNARFRCNNNDSLDEEPTKWIETESWFSSDVSDS